MNKALKIIIVLICIVLLITAIIFLLMYVKPNSDFKSNRKSINVQDVSTAEPCADKIHFLSTGSSDAILLESDGKFALIDCAEDTDNPRGFAELELDGYEDRVLEYLKTNAVSDDGKVHLDFVLGTHSHSDHIGGFDTIIADNDVEVGRAYLKVYDSSKIRQGEIDEWDNQEVYDQMVNALNERNVPIISQMDNTPFSLGNYTITLFNTADPENSDRVGENDQSLGVLVEKNGTKIFLSGDIDNKTGDEERLAPEIGEVDLLKVGHHSYAGSTTSVWLKTLKPKTCVVTNNYESLDMITIRRITRVCAPPILVTGKENGVVAHIGNNGEIKYYNNIH